jgi:HEXXH motif-containing protein
MSLPERPVAVAEMLVHEASHHYFHIVRRLEAVHDESDGRLYYSVVKGRERTIDLILLAFHAFANVALFYRSCMTRGLSDKGYCRKNLTRHIPELRMLLGHLKSSNAVTATGNLLWEPLAHRVFAN